MPAVALPLAPGSSGEPVRDLQRRLARAGFEHVGDAPGSFGAATETAVRRFQQARGLDVDGRCGAQTWQALVEAGYRLGDRLLYQGTTMLRGDDVADLQRRLGGLGFFAHRIDGIFGPLTAGATSDFQRNAGLTSDGICGPETVASLLRMGERPLQSVKAGLLEREHLRNAPRLLSGRRVMVGNTGGLGALGTAVARSLRDHGALVDVCGHPDQSTQASTANDFAADLYIGLQLASGPACLCSYYGRPDYESVGGRQLADLLARTLPPIVGAAVGEARAMRVPILRETWMVAVLCELGPPAVVVERTADVAATLASTLVGWAATPVDG